MRNSEGVGVAIDATTFDNWYELATAIINVSENINGKFVFSTDHLDECKDRHDLIKNMVRAK